MWMRNRRHIQPPVDTTSQEDAELEAQLAQLPDDATASQERRQLVISTTLLVRAVKRLRRELTIAKDTTTRLKKVVRAVIIVCTVLIGFGAWGWYSYNHSQHEVTRQNRINACTTKWANAQADRTNAVVKANNILSDAQNAYDAATQVRDHWLNEFIIDAAMVPSGTTATPKQAQAIATDFVNLTAASKVVEDKRPTSVGAKLAAAKKAYAKAQKDHPVPPSPRLDCK